MNRQTPLPETAEALIEKATRHDDKVRLEQQAHAAEQQRVTEAANAAFANHAISVQMTENAAARAQHERTVFYVKVAVAAAAVGAVLCALRNWMKGDRK